MPFTTAGHRQTLEETYYAGETLHLYPLPPPVLVTDRWCAYSDSSPLIEIVDRYDKSIEERIILPSTTPDTSITLEERLDSSFHNIPHVWTVLVEGTSKPPFPSRLVAKIYDPVWFGDAEWFDPFKLRNRSVSQEVESYHRFEALQGTKVPRFYGHFVTSLPSQCNRTVNVILMEYVHGRDLRNLVPSDNARLVCDMHKDVVIEAVLNLSWDAYTYGVDLFDLQPRNVILRPPKQGHEKQYCNSDECPLRLEVDPGGLQMVMVDFENVEFQQPDLGWERERERERERRKGIEKSKPIFLASWLEAMM
ncbi:hypothetical protein P691DRAFT_728320 [Macrolepiota fuliginosa MF-IS2]|uniref:Protein kinase domain-containing protein n=1 Tax=Macrolepiota fuliginosa MF-IS2 TaxID=1400762 RepID=A0A9P5XF72_9AGAR|nr:hypothetical protein P691DRAFT_728320 [Macrolepiota fuliginosa MF-IS2]